MGEFNFENVFEILYKPLKGCAGIKKEELYRNIFLEVYKMAGRPCSEQDSTEPFRKITSGNTPIQNYVAKKLHTEKGFEMTRQCVEHNYLGYFSNYDGIIESLENLIETDTFMEQRIKHKLLVSCPIPADSFHASRFITAILICANYKNRLDGKIESNVFLNMEFMHLEETEKQPEYPVFLTELPEDAVNSFIGRDADLEYLEQSIVANKESILLCGIGGIGKTELVKSLLNKIMNRKVEETQIRYVAWVSYIHQDLKQSCKAAFGFPEEADLAWRRVQDMASEHRKDMLLIIDNVEMREDDTCLKRLNGLPCRVLVTSRYKEVSALLSYEVKPLEKEECRQLFYHFYSIGKNDAYLDEIIELAARHTIMIEFLAKAAQLEEINLISLLDRLIEKGFKLSMEDVSSTHEQLTDQNTIIRQMCILFSLINVSREEQEILTYTSVIPNLSFDFGKAKDWFGVKKNSILYGLYKMGMLESRKKARKNIYWMHSVIAAAVREQQKSVLYNQVRPFIGKLSSELDYGDQWGQGYKKEYLIPFSWSVADIMEDKWEEEKDSDFLTRLYYVCFECGSYKLCGQLTETILKIDEANTDIPYMYLIRDYKNRGDYLMKMEKAEEALNIFRTAENMLGGGEWDQLEQILLWNKIGTAYQLKGDYGTAREYYEKVIEIEEKMDGVSPRELSTDYSSLGCLFLDMGLYEEAYDSIKKAIKLDADREEDAESIMSYCYLASVCSELYSAGHEEYYNEAVESFQKAITFREKNFNKQNTDLADIYHEYSLFLYYDGELEDAMRYSQMAYDINVSVHSQYSLSAIQNRNMQAIIMDAMDETEDALKIYDEILDIVRELDYIPDDDRAAFHYNKAEGLRKIGKIEQALQAYEESERMWSNLLSAQSPKLTPVFLGIGQCYMEQEKYQDAIDTFLKSLQVNQRDMEYELEAKNYLGECYCVCSDSANAEKYLLETLELIGKLGADEIGRGVLVCLNLSDLYLSHGDEKKSIEFLKRASKEAVASENEELIEYVKDFMEKG